MPRDFYDLFDVPADAPEDEIESEYNQMVKDYHPDLNDSDDAEDKFKTIQTAYETLTDEEERHRYDELGHVLYVRSYISGDLKGFEFTATAPEEDPISGAGSTDSSTETRSGSGGSTRSPSQSPTSRSTSSYSSSGSYTESSSGSDTGSVSTHGRNETTAPVTDIPFKPKIHRSVIVAVTSVLLIFALYLYSIVSVAVTGYTSGLEFISNLLTTPSEAVTGLNLAVQQPITLLTTLGTDPVAHLEIAFVFATSIVLPVTLATIVWRMGSGQRTLWLFPVGAAAPLVTFLVLYVAETPINGLFGAIPYIVIPMVAVVAFISDVTAHIVRKYVEFYVAYYTRRYVEYRDAVVEWAGQIRNQYNRKYRRFKRRWKNRYGRVAESLSDIFD